VNYPRLSRLSPQHYANRDESFHLTLNAHPKFPQFPEAIRSMIWDTVIEQRDADRVKTYAACLMPDHLHLLMAPVAMDVMKFASAFKSITTRRSWKLSNSNALWQPRTWDRTVRSTADFDAVGEYIVRNPVAAGLVENEREWPHNWAWWWDA
jgi:REP element-mobilizing transposase RayT